MRPVSPGTLFQILLPQGESRFDSPMTWMSYRYAGCVGPAVDVVVSETCHLGAGRIPILIGGAVRGFDRQYIQEIGDLPDLCDD